jgi:hypothetical protein
VVYETIFIHPTGKIYLHCNFCGSKVADLILIDCQLMIMYIVHS